MALAVERLGNADASFQFPQNNFGSNRIEITSTRRTLGALQRNWPPMTDVGYSRLIGWLKECPLYPQKRTLRTSVGMSALCQKQTYVVRQKFRYSITSSARPSNVIGRQDRQNRRMYQWGTKIASSRRRHHPSSSGDCHSSGDFASLKNALRTNKTT
jgi:hypothetical protein